MSNTSVQANRDKNTTSILITTLDSDNNQVPLEISTKTVLEAAINMARESGLKDDFEISIGDNHIFRIDHDDCVFKMIDFD